MSLYLLLIFSLLGIFLSISSKNWFIVWVGFEIKMFCVLPLLKETKNKGSELYYFMVQVLGTIFLVWGCVMNYDSYLGILGLFIKLGFFPFFWWVPSIFMKLNWFAMFIVSVVQKIPALFLIRWFDLEEMKVILMGMFTLSMGIMGMFNSIYSMKLLFGWSSVMKTSLAVQLMVTSKSFICFWFFSFYALISLFCCYSFHKSNLKKYNMISKVSKNSLWTLKGIISLFFFTGLPKLGFIYKIFFFQGFSKLNLEWIMMLWFVLKLFFQMVIYTIIFKYYFINFFDLKIYQNFSWHMILVCLYFGFVPLFFIFES